MEGRIRGALLHHEVQPAAWALILAAAVIVAVCYANSLQNDFILDDYAIVALNPAIRTIAPFQFLKTPYWGEKSNSGIYRPLTILSYSMEYPLWHRWPGGYRLTNLLLHTINGLLIFLIARGLLQSTAGAYAVSALYLAHPAHTEPVVALAGRSELLAAMFFFLAWLLFRQGRPMLSAAVFFLALLSKENAIALPAVLLLDSAIKPAAIDRRYSRLVPVCVSALLYLGLRFWVLGGVGVPASAQYLEGRLTFMQRELTSGRAFLKMLELLVAPVNVTGDYDFNSIPIATMTDWVAWAGVGAIAALIVLALWLLRRQPLFSFAILFFFITIFPTSNWVMPTSILMSERALYLPSLAICFLAALVWSKVNTGERRKLLAIGVMATAAVLCIAHNYIWRDDLTYFGNMVRVLPDNVRGRQGYGTALAEAGLAEEARKQFEAGLAINRNAPLLVGLSQAYIQIDRDCRRARPALNEAQGYSPSDPFVSWLLASCYEKEGSLEQAEARYRRAVSDARFPDPKLLTDWERVLRKTGRPAEADDAHRRAALLQ